MGDPNGVTNAEFVYGIDASDCATSGLANTAFGMQVYLTSLGHCAQYTERTPAHQCRGCGSWVTAYAIRCEYCAAPN